MEAIILLVWRNQFFSTATSRKRSVVTGADFSVELWEEQHAEFKLGQEAFLSCCCSRVEHLIIYSMKMVCLDKESIKQFDFSNKKKKLCNPLTCWKKQKSVKQYIMISYTTYTHMQCCFIQLWKSFTENKK